MLDTTCVSADGAKGRRMELYQATLEAVYQQFDAQPSGLTTAEAAKRLEIHGFNELQTRTRINPLLIFIDQFKSFIIYILLFAVLFSLLIGEYVDSLIILLILLTNAIIGFYQEYGAHKSLEALKRISTLQARVVRDGKRQVIDARDLVPGDVISLEAGDRVPADARIISAVQLKAEESALTGESLPVEKSPDPIATQVPLGDRHNMLFSPTTLVTGNASALVVATGMATELGRITTLVKEAETELTPLQRRLDQFGRRLSYAIICICLIVFALFFTKDYFAGTLSGQSFLALAFIAISLAVAAVPTALPAVVTIALSIGVKRLLAKKALVRNLSSVETLGSCDVICTDKTGTLTGNQMTVRYAWTLESEVRLGGVGYDPGGELYGSVDAELLTCGLLCNNASLNQEADGWKVIGDPTEAALLVSAAKAGIADSRQRATELPFDSQRKLMSVVVGAGEGAVLYSKGALDKVLGCCTKVLVGNKELPLDAELRSRIEAQNSSYADQALRVLGFARKAQAADAELAEQGMIFLGLQAMIDPPRPDVVESIRKTKQAGIRVIMITGDFGATAKAIGAEIGIEGGCLTGEELQRLDAQGLQAALAEGVNIFSRVSPEHKQRIVDALQQMGKTVAMTGDGVNDAPALKKANIGVAVGSGTEVAKEAADFVLLDDSFTHIVNAIEEGRGIYDNIQKSIMLLLSGNLGEVLIIFFAALFGLNLPLTAILLLWINMVTDGAPALAYSVDPYGKAIMLRKPKPRDEGILPQPKLLLLAVLGSVGSAIALALFYFFGGASDSAAQLLHAQTLVFNFVVLYEVILTFVIRSSYRVPFFANRWVWAAALLSLLLQALLMYTPLAKVFRIVPLGGTSLAVLAAAGVLFAALSLLYQAVMEPREKSLP
ncbi:MAG TPA: cation-translocating P-type ATPase [Malonomonas sp.]